MAVYTELNKHAVQRVLGAYQLGELLKFSPISSGIENTNYFVWTSEVVGGKNVSSEWVLTIFENLPKESIPFFNRSLASMSNVISFAIF